MEITCPAVTIGRQEIQFCCTRLRAVKPWNFLPEEVVIAPCVQAFKARIDRAWNNQPLKFH